MWNLTSNRWNITINRWIPKARLEPENVDWFAVAVKKEGQIAGHLNKGNLGYFAKTIFYFLRANHGNTCQVEFQGERINLGDGQGLQVACILQFSGEEKYIRIWKTICCVS